MLVNVKDPFLGYTAVHWAAKLGDVDMLALLAGPELAVNAQSHGGYTPLHLAYLHDRPDAQRKLKEMGASEVIADNAGRLPLFLKLQQSAPVRVHFPGVVLFHTLPPFRRALSFRRLANRIPSRTCAHARRLSTTRPKLLSSFVRY